MNVLTEQQISIKNTIHSNRVVIVGCPDYEEPVLSEKLLEGFSLSGGVKKYIKTGYKVFVKPNFIRAPRFPGDTPVTNPALLYSFCRILKDCGAIPVLGDSPAFGSVRRILRKCGYEDKMENLGVTIVQLKRGVKIRREINGEEKTIYIAREVAESDIVINVPKLKVHCQLGMSLAIKNLFGCVPGKRKAWRHMLHGERGAGFPEMIIETCLAVDPAFTILDGITAMERHGPTGGDVKHVGLLFFSENCFAMEKAVAQLLGVRSEHLPILDTAEKIYGNLVPENIEITGLNPEEIVHVRLVPARRIPVRFSLLRVVKSALRNVWITKVRRTE